MKIPKLNARFQAQTWIKDHAVDVSSTRFDAGKAFLLLDPPKMSAAVRSIIAGKNHDLDPVAEREGLVGGEGRHNGPFYVDIDPIDFEDWCKAIGTTPAELTAIDWPGLSKLRESVGMRGDGVERLMTGTVVDWRVSDGADEDLTEVQKKPWPVEIVKSGYDGLILEFKAPDGTQRQLMIEIEQGNLKILTYRDPEVSEQPDCAIHILPEGTAVSSTTTLETGYVLFHEHGSLRESGEIPASFADEAATPTL
ncbi:hypothetical protein [Bosea sp. RAC05]|uniref:hypothetical protein n=1 Tax=Bosea sp. RAC05 TaxID=1842539 RepID=UPI00083D8080|nr:hypothetical protein [Bosea sp. RAC05]AOG02987.1 hypothetical protein BSY19_4901 [Bosea sp. RAC05]